MMSVNCPRVVDWAYFKEYLIDTKSIDPPDTIFFEGREVPVHAMVYERLSVDEMKRMRIYSIRHASSPRPLPEQVCLVDFQIFKSEGRPDGVSFGIGGHLYTWGDCPGLRYEKPERFRSYVQCWNHMVYAGRHWFQQVAALEVPFKIHFVGDISIHMYEEDLDIDDHKANVQLAALYPLPDLEESFVSTNLYQKADYSIYSETYHGPMADQVGEQWSGHMQVPCDGAGLFASRFGDRAYCSDIATGPWVHRAVQYKTLTDTLRSTPEGSLQVLFYCLAFMTDEDYSYIRHPYIIVDRYRPPIKAPFQSDFCSSSLYFDITPGEPPKERNPPYSRNLLLRKEATFYRDHLVSQYARAVGLPDSGPKVTQTWTEMLTHPDDYCAMVGMVPIIEGFSDVKRHYSRIIYYTRGEKPESVPYAKQGQRYYFYFPQATVYSYPSLGKVHEFPSVSGKEYVGRTINDLESEYGTKISDYLVPLFESHGVRLVGTFFRDISDAKCLTKINDLSKPFELSDIDAAPLLLAGRIRSVANQSKKYQLVIQKLMDEWRVYSQYGEVARFVGDRPMEIEMIEKYGPGRWKGHEWQVHCQYWKDNKWEIIGPRDFLPLGPQRIRCGTRYKEVTVSGNKKKRRTVAQWMATG